MFLLNNKHGRDHRQLYPSKSHEEAAIFDISEDQLKSAKNEDWFIISEGDIGCVVQPSLKMSTIYQFEGISEGTAKDLEGILYKTQILRGHVVGKFVDEVLYSVLLSNNAVSHKMLNGSSFSPGFNVANLKSQLNDVAIQTASGSSTVAELKQSLEHRWLQYLFGKFWEVQFARAVSHYPE